MSNDPSGFYAFLLLIMLIWNWRLGSRLKKSEKLLETIAANSSEFMTLLKARMR